MGFDIHGMNPVVRKGKKPEKPEGLYEGKKIDDKIVDEYWEKVWKFEEENVGAYFRNNVWWWRGLWDYVREVCYDIISEDEYNEGHTNSGLTIDEDRATKIAKRLNQLIKDGKAQSHIDLWEARRKVAEEHNKGLKKGTSDKNYKWEDSYPMHIENVQHFADFCADSGGFQIC